MYERIFAHKWKKKRIYCRTLKLQKVAINISKRVFFRYMIHLARAYRHIDQIQPIRLRQMFVIVFVRVADEARVRAVQ